MNNLFAGARSPSEQRLRERIFNVLPAASFQFDRLLQLLDIVESDLSPTACVECSTRPRLHLNPGFVAEYCRRDEHLFVLILHEIYHIVLGHTRLFARPTPLHNLAFDAVINSLLAHQFPEQRYLDFFQALNPWDSFPARLLRPPPGWPAKPEPLPEGAGPAERKAMRLLYGKDHNAATYYDVFEALVKTLLEKGGGTGEVEKCVLLGDHSGEASRGALDEEAVGDDLLKQLLRRIVEGWPPPPTPIAGRDEGREAADFLLPRSKFSPPAFEVALRRLFRRAGILGPSSHVARREATVLPCRQEIQTVLPDFRDRRVAAFEKLWRRRPILFQGERSCRKRVLTPTDVAFVYVDISGSMNACLPALWAALWKPHREGAVRLFVFSTVVDEVHPRRPLNEQKLKNTGGTEINCVLEHFLALPGKTAPKRVVLLTDGYTGQPRSDLLERLKACGTSLFVGLVGPNTSHELRPYAKHIEQLPNLDLKS